MTKYNCTVCDCNCIVKIKGGGMKNTSFCFMGFMYDVAKFKEVDE